jgi:hypothetical protein
MLVQCEQNLDVSMARPKIAHLPKKKKVPRSAHRREEGKGATDTLEMPPLFDHPHRRTVAQMVTPRSKIYHSCVARLDPGGTAPL